MLVVVWSQMVVVVVFLFCYCFFFIVLLCCFHLSFIFLFFFFYCKSRCFSLCFLMYNIITFVVVILFSYSKTTAFQDFSSSSCASSSSVLFKNKDKKGHRKQQQQQQKPKKKKKFLCIRRTTTTTASCASFSPSLWVFSINEQTNNDYVFLCIDASLFVVLVFVKDMRLLNKVPTHDYRVEEHLLIVMITWWIYLPFYTESTGCTCIAIQPSDL